MSNLLKQKYPHLYKEWDFKKNNIDITIASKGSNKKVFWKCKKGHSFEALIKNRIKGTKCPYCTNRKVGYGNDLNTKFPEIAKEWDYTRNQKRPEEYTPGSGYRAAWICKNNHHYYSYIKDRTTRKLGCLQCSKIPSEKNNFKTEYPQIAKEWDYTRNKKRPEEFFPHSNFSVYWVCKKNHSYKTKIANRTSNRGTSCPVCAGKIVDKSFNLKTEYPQIAKEWDYTRNKKRPEEYTPTSGIKVFWKCSKNHFYSMKISSRTFTSSDPKYKYYPQACPFCANRKLGYGNDFKSQYSELAKEWDYTRNKKRPEEFFPQTKQKVWWICKNTHSWKSSISNRIPRNEKDGTGCPYCKLTPRSKEEIYLMFELKKFFDIKTDDHKIKLLKIEDVDIVLRKEKIVIEYDGAYWHKDKAERDKKKTKALQNDGWTVLRVREKPLPLLSKKYNVFSIVREYKKTADSTLNKLSQLGYEIEGLEKYLKRKNLVNKKEADKYIDKLLKNNNLN